MLGILKVFILVILFREKSTLASSNYPGLIESSSNASSSYISPHASFSLTGGCSLPSYISLPGGCSLPRYSYSPGGCSLPSYSFSPGGRSLPSDSSSPGGCSLPSSSSSSVSSNLGSTCECGFIRKPQNCLELKQRGFNTSGVYHIAPCNQRPCDEVEVYCDMETDGGGWTVFQHRGNDTTMEFNRSFKDYARGFGNAAMDFWLGNDYIHCLTSQTYTQLMVVMKDWCNKSLKEHYNCFFLSDKKTRYELRLRNYTGESNTDSLMQHSNVKFSTQDLDTGNRRAFQFKSGWWHTVPYSNLNGVYKYSDELCKQRKKIMKKCASLQKECASQRKEYPTQQKECASQQKQYAKTCNNDGIFWKKWHGITYSLKETTMMLRGWQPQDYTMGSKCYGIDCIQT